MLSVVVIAFSLQAASVDPLAGEGERLGRLSTLFAVCEPYYAVNIDAGHRLAEDFRQRSADAGWTAGQRSAAYDRGRDLERAELGIVMESSGVTPQEARRLDRGQQQRDQHADDGDDHEQFHQREAT